MRSIFIAFAALIVATQAVSLQILRKNHLKEIARAQSSKGEVQTFGKLFGQQSIGYKIPKGELTEEDKERIY